MRETIKLREIMNSMVVHWLGLHAFTAMGLSRGSLVGELKSLRPRSAANKQTIKHSNKEIKELNKWKDISRS